MLDKGDDDLNIHLRLTLIGITDSSPHSYIDCLFRIDSRSGAWTCGDARGDTRGWSCSAAPPSSETYLSLAAEQDIRNLVRKTEFSRRQQYREIGYFALAWEVGYRSLLESSLSRAVSTPYCFGTILLKKAAVT